MVRSSGLPDKPMASEEVTVVFDVIVFVVIVVVFIVVVVVAFRAK